MTDKNDLQREVLSERYSYCPDTGIFTRMKSGHGKTAGEKAGTCTSNGYIFISILRRQYLAHRLAWLWVHGHMPKFQIDHINRIGTDNRIANLREATGSQNACNRAARAGSKSGVKGVHWQPKVKRWRVAICLNGKSKFYGYFDTINEAREVYRVAAEKTHGAFARTE